MHFALLGRNLGVPNPTALFWDSIRGFKMTTQEYVTFFYFPLK